MLIFKKLVKPIFIILIILILSFLCYTFYNLPPIPQRTIGEIVLIKPKNKFGRVSGRSINQDHVWVLFEEDNELYEECFLYYQLESSKKKSIYKE